MGFVILTTDDLNKEEIPNDLKGYVTVEQWKIIREHLSPLENSSLRTTFFFEMFCCIFCIFPCIFCCHDAIHSSISYTKRMRYPLSINHINHSYFTDITYI
jgi:hypothetical protein